MIEEFMDIKIDKIVRSKRKTIGLEITPSAELIVRAPLKASFEELNKVVLKKRTWIERNQRFFKENYNRIKPKDFIDGEEFRYLGNVVKLKIAYDIDVPLILDDNHFHLSNHFIDDARGIFEYWYREQAKKKIDERVAYYSWLMGIESRRVNITNALKRWGSCGTNGNLNFSWRLIMAPLRVIDYLVVHELSHVEVKNHSKEFWSKVERMIPDYRGDEKWLRDNGHFLVL
ncbi:M48 family metallopeptidase [Desulfobacterota bacterium AH_259_B03_O07]|nr:M48 family metallopeptidase [Desulfobacterota bacterium AH_259_B03_O07]